MIIPVFQDNDTYLPITLQQFQDLTNELLNQFNTLLAPQFLDGNYMAQVVHSVIHSLDRKTAIVKKSELLDGCINMVSKHVTYRAIQEIEAQLKAKKAAEGQPGEPSADNVVDLGQEPA